MIAQLGYKHVGKTLQLVKNCTSDQPGHVGTFETGIDVHDSDVRGARIEHTE
jgi:hypothetical protein